MSTINKVKLLLRLVTYRKRIKVAKVVTNDWFIELISIAEALMKKANIPLRDTWKGYYGYNHDDLKTNNGYNGPKQITVKSIKDDTSAANFTSEGRYLVEGFSHWAYDKAVIIVPTRLKMKKSVIIHELVHFLQENDLKSDKNYIKYESRVDDPEFYRKYIWQRQEAEAHFIQLKYLFEYGVDELKVDEGTLEWFKKEVVKHDNLTNKAKWDLLVMAKSKKVLG